MHQCVRVKQLGYPEVSNLCSERLSEQHTASIEVTMYDGDGVEVGQAIGNISEDAGLVREGMSGYVFMH